MKESNKNQKNELLNMFNSGKDKLLNELNAAKDQIVNELSQTIESDKSKNTIDDEKKGAQETKVETVEVQSDRK